MSQDKRKTYNFYGKERSGHSRSGAGRCIARQGTPAYARQTTTAFRQLQVPPTPAFHSAAQHSTYFGSSGTSPAPLTLGTFHASHGRWWSELLRDETSTREASPYIVRGLGYRIWRDRYGSGDMLRDGN